MSIEKIKNTSAHIAKFTKAVGCVSFVCVLVMMLMNVVDVVMGKLFNMHVLGAYELTQRLLMCAVFTAFAYGQSQKSHINMTIIIAFFPRPVRFVIFTLMSLLGVISSGVMTYAAAYQIMVCVQKAYCTEVLYIPLWPFYLIETVAMAIFTFALLYDLILSALAIARQDVADLVQSQWS